MTNIRGSGIEVTVRRRGNRECIGKGLSGRIYAAVRPRSLPPAAVGSKFAPFAPFPCGRYSLAPILQHTTVAMSRHTLCLLLPFLLLPYTACAHKHHDQLTEEEATAAVDSILWIHIFLQAAVWSVLFPIGMVLGLSRSRWHVPLQVRTARPSSTHPVPPLPSLPRHVYRKLLTPYFHLPPPRPAPRPARSITHSPSLCAP